MKLRRRDGLEGDKLCTAGREKNITFSRWWIFPIFQRQVHKLVQLGEKSGNEWVRTAKRPQSWWLILLSGKLNQIASLKQSAHTPPQQTSTPSLTHIHKCIPSPSRLSVHPSSMFGRFWFVWHSTHSNQVGTSAQVTRSFHTSQSRFSFYLRSTSTLEIPNKDG